MVASAPQDGCAAVSVAAEAKVSVATCIDGAGDLDAGDDDTCSADAWGNRDIVFGELETLILRAADAQRRRDRTALGPILEELRSVLAGHNLAPRPPGTRAEMASTVDRLLVRELLVGRGASAEWLGPMLLHPELAEAAEGLMEELTDARRDEVLRVVLPGSCCGQPLQLAVSVGAKRPDWSMADGRFLWHSGCALASQVLNGTIDVRGKRVLELGCGLGAVGLTCARAGAEAVILTDYDDDVLRACERSASLNCLNQVSTHLLDWVEFIEGDTVPEVLRGFDLILGGDIIYEDRHAALILSVARRFLREAGAFDVYLATGEPSARVGIVEWDSLLGVKGLHQRTPELGLDVTVEGTVEDLCWTVRRLPEVDQRAQRLYHLSSVEPR
eukprot:TRINITY_DN11756_c0_g1_i1.p1 TRINITY_DN11756_c0_g1~~TRINITY_DN11756_c0_g1_i1.p1  ORF type:complete len:406 (+),score=67.80 TRINITY_DN11756_c0_g1_i1:59-1219(+)